MLSVYSTIKIDGKYVTKTSLMKQWNLIIKRIPFHIKRAAASSSSIIIGHGISHTAYKMMSAMGWQGDALRTDGVSAPIQAPEGRAPRQGLGYTDPKHRKQRSRPKLAAYNVDGKIVYAKEGDGILKEYELDPLGMPTETTHNLGWHHGAMPILWWKLGVKGVAEFLYPHPSGWTYNEAQDTTALDDFTVKKLTQAFIHDNEQPKCISSWSNKKSSWHLNINIDWLAYGRLFQNKLATTKDVNLFLIHIIYRRLVVRAHAPEEDGYSLCRCCNRSLETQTHLAYCSILRPIWQELARLTTRLWKTTTPNSAFIFLGIRGTHELPPLALRVLHAIVWKMLLIY